MDTLIVLGHVRNSFRIHDNPCVLEPRGKNIYIYIKEKPTYEGETCFSKLIRQESDIRIISYKLVAMFTGKIIKYLYNLYKQVDMSSREVFSCPSNEFRGSSPNARPCNQGQFQSGNASHAASVVNSI